MPESDDELWRRCTLGDEAALTTLYRRHVQAIYRHAFRATGDCTRSEDVVSITFAEVWRLRTRSVEAGSVLPWLYGVATNVLRNEQRTTRRYQRLLSHVHARGHDRSDNESPDIAARLDDQRRARSLLAQVRDLPERERELIALCWWTGLTHEQAAAALEIPLGTVKSRLARARARLGHDDIEQFDAQMEEAGDR